MSLLDNLAHLLQGHGQQAQPSPATRHQVEIAGEAAQHAQQYPGGNNLQEAINTATGYGGYRTPYMSRTVPYADSSQLGRHQGMPVLPPTQAFGQGMLQMPQNPQDMYEGQNMNTQGQSPRFNYYQPQNVQPFQSRTGLPIPGMGHQILQGNSFDDGNINQRFR
jgi:hypothetical protein